eukprot:1376554-Amphidinium_carterae.1
MAGHFDKSSSTLKIGSLMCHWGWVWVDTQTLNVMKSPLQSVIWTMAKWYWGDMRRGAPASLKLVKLPPRVTTKKAPGPGPIQLKMCIPSCHSIDLARMASHRKLSFH